MSETKIDPVAAAILEILEDGKDKNPQEIAQLIAAARRKPKDEDDLWRKYLPAVKQQALFLARKGYIHWIRKDSIVTDHYKVKGLVKYRIAK